MILDFNIFSNTRFRVNSSIYPRLFRVKQSTEGISLVNISTGDVILKNTQPEDITIAGVPLNNAAELQKIVYNLECFCTPDGIEFKIFDLHFSREFE